MNRHARKVLLTASLNTHFLFYQLLNVMQPYKLPNPLLLLDNPHTKSFKKVVKARVVDYWEIKLKDEAAYLPSLKYFHCQYFSLCQTHIYFG